MNFEELLYRPETMENIRDCKNEILGTLIIMNIIAALVACILWCVGQASSKKIEKLEQKNKTLKNIIFSAMESGILRMMHYEDPNEDLHED